MKTNFHTHSTWCDGRDTLEANAAAAVEKGFSILGFSSHISDPEDAPGTLSRADARNYANAVRNLAARYCGKLKIYLGLEADFIPGVTTPERARYAHLKPDYIIGSIHYVVAPDGGCVCVDNTPEILQAGIAAHFGGCAEDYVRAYFRQQREMAQRFDFDIIGHPDLVRKFNAKHPYFDETAPWYREELLLTAEAFAASGKLTEVNTGAISRGWLNDAYPAPTFRELLRARGVRFVLSADAHAAAALDCAFDRFATAEDYVLPTCCTE